MANERNLKKFSDMPKERLKELTKKGGKKSAEVRRNHKFLKDLSEELLNGKPNREQIKAIKELYPNIPKDEITNGMAILAANLEKALQGDVRASVFLRDTAGQKPVDRLDIKEEGMTHITVTHEFIGMERKGYE